MTRQQLNELFYLTDELDIAREWKKRLKNKKHIRVQFDDYTLHPEDEKIDVQGFLVKELDKRINLIEKKFKSFGVEV